MQDINLNLTTAFHKVHTVLQNHSVASLLDKIITNVNDGGISIVNSETGSGKSLLIPLSIAEATGEVVYVLQPRRFLAINAVDSLCKISDTKAGDVFGYLVGGAEENKCNRNTTRVIYTTYGYALASGIIMNEKNIILDEIHEQSMDMTVAQSVLHRRLSDDNTSIDSLVLMSATLTAEELIPYWEKVNESTKLFNTESKSPYVCKMERGTSVVSSIEHLITEGKTGILVFCEGVYEINKHINDIELSLSLKYPDQIEVFGIHGSSDHDEREEAFADPTKPIKILVGTNVLESGMNIPWVDAGVSTGYKKELTVRKHSGAVYLDVIPLCKDNVYQQKGRTNRFSDSIFILNIDYEELKVSTEAEVLRLPLTSLFMHCIKFGFNPNDLHLLPTPTVEDMKHAEGKLLELGLITPNYQFTEAGDFVKDLPVSYETGLMLYYADKVGRISEVIPLAAAYEIKSLKLDFKEGYLGIHSKSDFISLILAYLEAKKISSTHMSYADKKIEFARLNVSKKRIDEFEAIGKQLEKIFGPADFDLYEKMKDYVPNFVNAEEDFLHECLLAACATKLGILQGGRHGSFSKNFINGRISLSSSVVIDFDLEFSSSELGAADLRFVTPRLGARPFYIADNITRFKMIHLLNYLKASNNTNFKICFECLTNGMNKVRVEYNKNLLIDGSFAGMSINDIAHWKYALPDIVEIKGVTVSEDMSVGDIFKSAVNSNKDSVIKGQEKKVIPIMEAPAPAVEKREPTAFELAMEKAKLKKKKK